MTSSNQLTAMISDDSIEMRQLLRFTLNNLHCTVIAACDNGNDVIPLLNNYKPQLLFLDIEMPGKTGLDLLTDIKDQDLNTYPVIVSGNNSFHNVKQAIERGAKGFIVKPFTHSKVQQIVNKYRKENHLPLLE